MFYTRGKRQISLIQYVWTENERLIVHKSLFVTLLSFPMMENAGFYVPGANYILQDIIEIIL